MIRVIRQLRDFLVELKRRKVYRVAVLYVVVAVGSLQLVDAVIPSTRLPDWSDEFFLALVVLGFPLAVVLAWAFEMTPEGVRRTSETATRETDRRARTSPSGAPIADGAGTGSAGDDAPPPEPGVRSVAILPFENLSRKDEAEPLVAGLHDDLLTSLSKIRGLTVISRTSVRSYRETAKQIPEIARELNVGTIVEGGVQSAGGRVRLNVQLIDARRDTHRWAETYDRELSTDNIFDIQSELAQRIVESLHAELAGAEQARIERAATDDLDAYRLYARARTHLDQRTEDGLGRALDCFRSAVQRDPGHAPAWAGLAETLLLFGFYDYELPDDPPDPESAAHRAVELDPDLGEAHVALGILYSLRHDGARGLAELERGTELGPSDAEAHIWLGWAYLVLGRPAKALESARRAAQLNPHAPAVRLYLAEAWLANEETGNALKEARRAREIQPEYGLAHFVEGLALYHLGRPTEAESTLMKALELASARGTPSRAEIRALLALARSKAGGRAVAREQLARIEEEADGKDDFPVGLIHAALGETDRAFAAFGRVERWTSPATELIRYAFPDVLATLREDPRYEDLLRKVDRSWGIPEER